MKLAGTGMVVMTVAVVLLGASAASAWYPYSEKYTKWQKDRPLTIAAWHASVPTDHLEDRIARMKAAGINTFYWCKLLNGAHFYQAAHDGDIEWGGGIHRKLAVYFEGTNWRKEHASLEKGLERNLQIPGGALVGVMDVIEDVGEWGDRSRVAVFRTDNQCTPFSGSADHDQVTAGNPVFNRECFNNFVEYLSIFKAYYEGPPLFCFRVFHKLAAFGWEFLF